MGAVSVLHLDGGRAWAGGQNQVRLLMRALASRGVRQRCLCPRGSPLAERLRAEGLPVEPVGWRGGADPRAVAAVARQVGGFGVVHCHDSHALQIALLPAKLARTPIVAARRFHRRVRALVWNRADRVVAISGVVEAALARSGVDRKRIRRVPSAVDRDEVACLPRPRPTLRERLGVGPEACIAGNIGHLYGYKDQRTIVAAAARQSGVHWAIIGDGPQRPALEAAIAEHGIQDRVHLTGFIPDARRILSELDLFVFPSVREALGTSVLDAMAADVPVVAADAGGPGEVLRPVHERTGASLFPAGDPAGLADRVRSLAASRPRREAVRAAQAERIEAYGIERAAERMLDVYTELVTP